MLKFLQKKQNIEQEIARLRLEHTSLSLQELGQMLNPPVGKSGVNHRMRRLMDIAKEIRAELPVVT